MTQELDPIPRFSVAPMMDWTDRHCRYFHRLLSPHALLYSEMIVAQAIRFGDRKRLLAFHPDEHPVALQLGGSDPALLAEAACIGADFGYDEINLNVGCPSDRVQCGQFGACLMLNPPLVAECIAAMRAAVAVPVTVKCRLGVDDHDSFESFMAFIDTVASAGCTRFIVHARKAWLSGLSPRENREVPPLWYDRVFALKRLRPALHVSLNGGIDHVDTAVSALDQVDAVMLGRAIYQKPWLLTELEQRLHGTPEPDPAEVLFRVDRYIEQHIAQGGAANHVLRHMLGLFHGQTGAREFRQLITGVKSWQPGKSLARAADAVGLEWPLGIY